MKTKRVINFALTLIMLVSVICAPIGPAGNVKAAPRNYDSEELKGVKEFVTRLYAVCLDREPEDGGLKFWMDELIDKKATGNSVAYGFIFSPEFQDKKMTNEQYVTYMYAAFFGRIPDEEGLKYWVDLLNKGKSREFVFCGFTDSREFAEICEQYGIFKGYHIEGSDYQKTAMINLFVERLYNVILDRNCDLEGMAYWTTALSEHTISGGETAYGFVFSPEFIGKNLCNEHYTDVLYESLLGRTAEASGKAFWVDLLNQNTPREEIFNDFVNSPEFRGICESYGIESGNIIADSKTIGAEGECVMCAGNNTAGNTTAGYNSTGNNTAGNNSTGNTTAGNNSTGNTTAGNNSTGNNTAGNNNTGNNTAGNNGTGNNTAGNNGTGNNTAGNNSTGNNTNNTNNNNNNNVSSNPRTYDQYLCYDQFGAMGDGKTDDYEAIVRTHEEANRLNLPVKARPGAKYYVCNMNAKNLPGALIKTDTDWTGAEFIIDDTKMTYESGETECYLFTVAPSEEGKEKYINYGSDNSLKLGLDPLLFDAPNHPTNVTRQMANQMKNKSFPAGTTKVEGEFPEKALYILKSGSLRRWGRFGDHAASASAREQTEVIIVNKDGTIDSATPIQWNWQDIYDVKMYKIDEEPLYVTGGKFTTKVNMLVKTSSMGSPAYCHRGINVRRSNVVIDGVEHYLEGENYKEDERPSKGAPYHGFIKLQNCAYVTVKNCVFSEHKCVYYNPQNNARTAPYDLYAEYCCDVTVENCKDDTDIKDQTRWGSASNFCKNFVFDGCELSRIDAHMGMYNLTVKNCTLGYYSVAAVGFGDLLIQNTTSYGDSFLTFRQDFGCPWFGDVKIKDCTWVCSRYDTTIIKAMNFDTTKQYGFDEVTVEGKTYYSQMASNIEIDGFVYDVSSVDNPALRTQMIQVFSLTSTSKTYDEDFLKNGDEEHNHYPIMPPKTVTLKNLTIIKHPSLKNKEIPVVLVRDKDAVEKYLADLSQRDKDGLTRKDAAFYSGTTFIYDESGKTNQIVSQ